MIKKTLLSAVILLLVFAFSPSLADEYRENLYIFERDGYYGYMDYEHNIVIPPNWGKAYPLKNGLALVWLNDEAELPSNNGLIDTNGLYIIPPCYLIEECESSYIYSIVKGDSLLYGFYDKSTGFLMPPTYEYVCDNSSEGNNETGFIEVQLNEKWGFCRRSDGTLVIPCIYDEVLESFSNGYALVCTGLEKPSPLGFYDRYDLIDCLGNRIGINSNVMPVSAPSSDGTFIIMGRVMHKESLYDGINTNNIMYGIADVEGDIIVEPTYVIIGSFVDNLAWFCNQDMKWGVMDANGCVVIEPKYEVEQNYEFQPVYFVNGYAVRQLVDNELIIVDEIGKETLLNLNMLEIGNVSQVLPNTTMLVYSVENDSANDCGFIDVKGNVLTEAVYSNWYDVSENMIRVRKNGKYGFIDKNGQEVIPCIYDDAYDFVNSTACVKLDGSILYINHEGTVVWNSQ